MKYPKRFEKWYNKNYAGRSVFGPDEEEKLKHYLYEAWKASLQIVDRRMSNVRRWSDGHYQHEDFDHLQEFVKELIK